MTKKWRCPVLDRGSCKYENPGFRLSSIIISTPPPHPSNPSINRPPEPVNWHKIGVYFYVYINCISEVE